MSNDSEPALSPQSVHIEKHNALGIITLDRPEVLNALDGEMRATIAEALPTFPADPIIYAIALQSTSEKAFCAGGDVCKIIEAFRKDPAEARRLFAEEYRLNWALECFSRPSVSLIDGVVMGSGVGLTAFNTHRVAGEKYRFAMPETSIGLFPDVGVSHILAGLPNEIGVYLGLTGRRLGRADAYALGLATHCIPASRFSEIKEALAEAWPIDGVLDERHVDPGEGPLLRHSETISHCFSGESIPDILARLASVEGADADWAAVVRTELLECAPLSLAVSLRHIREARDCGIRETLKRDYRLACRFLEGRDFAEGVRALLIDKDKSPVWRPATISEVTASEVDRYFEPLPDGDLQLATRDEMQSLP
jgi:enoyl-CoA hydratase/carnithine racemase